MEDVLLKINGSMSDGVSDGMGGALRKKISEYKEWTKLILNEVKEVCEEKSE